MEQYQCCEYGYIFFLYFFFFVSVELVSNELCNTNQYVVRLIGSEYLRELTLGVLLQWLLLSKIVLDSPLTCFRGLAPQNRAFSSFY